MLLFALFWLCQLSCSGSKGDEGITGLATRWYGPSYQPRWWSPSSVSLRQHDFSYEGVDGSIIGLSIGVVLGSIRAVSLDGVPHSEDETPCKTLISHIIGGLLSGALIGLVYVFFKECLFV